LFQTVVDEAVAAVKAARDGLILLAVIVGLAWFLVTR
jgi:hypothetical protein